MRLFLVMLLTLLLAGCARSPLIPLYAGAERPDSELLQIDVPVELGIIMINERRVDGVNRVLGLDSRTLQLEPGRYRILASYKELFQLPDGNHEVVKSDPVIFEVEGTAGSHFQLDYERPANAEQGRALARNFEGYSVNLADNSRRPTRPAGIPLHQGLISLDSGRAEEDTRPALNSLDLLKASWLNASADERRAFLHWLAQQPTP